MEKTNKRKQRIIDAAMETLKSNSIEEVSMRKIAAVAGLTTGAIYHFYHSKDELLLDVMKQQLHFTTRLYETIHSQTEKKDSAEILAEINNEVLHRIKKVEEQKIHVRFFSNVIKGECKIRGEYIENYNKMIAATANLFEDAFSLQDHGYHKAIASILVAAIDGIAMQQALEVLPNDVDMIANTYIQFFNESIPIFLNKHQ